MNVYSLLRLVGGVNQRYFSHLIGPTHHKNTQVSLQYKQKVHYVPVLLYKIAMRGHERTQLVFYSFVHFLSYGRNVLPNTVENAKFLSIIPYCRLTSWSLTSVPISFSGSSLKSIPSRVVILTFFLFRPNLFWLMNHSSVSGLSAV